MNIEQIAAERPQARPPAVPEWSLGCFHRRCITYATGVEDTTTRVIWIQSHGLTGDIRVPAARPSVTHRAGVAECTQDELQALLLAEGGVADTAWDGERMSWSNWTAFQPYDKWPEPGELRRVGASLLEFAPSGVYVEDWRAQPPASGLLIGLRLVSENDAPREGGLVIAGEHALMSLGRREPLPAEAPLSEQLTQASAASRAALLDAIFDSQTLYARRRPDGYQVRLSTSPFLEGTYLDLGGFSPGAAADELVQEVRSGASALRRIWRIDTLLPAASLSLTTAADRAGIDWLARERTRLPGVG